jgi:hypothetical protein
MTLQVGNLVRVVRQPSNQIVQLVGDVGVINEILNDMADITTIHLDGSAAGCGAVPLFCLEAEARPEWTLAYERKLVNDARVEREYNAFQAHMRAGMAEISRRFGLPEETCREIHLAVARLYP